MSPGSKVPDCQASCLCGRGLTKGEDVFNSRDILDGGRAIKKGREGGGGSDRFEVPVALCVVFSAALFGRHNEARDAKDVRVECTALIPHDELQRRWGTCPVGELEVGRTETPSFVNVLQSLLESLLVRIENPNFANVVQELLDSPLQPRKIGLLQSEQLLWGGVEKAVRGLRSPSLLALIWLEPLEWVQGLQIGRTGQE